jgi:hypothetical protein
LEKVKESSKEEKKGIQEVIFEDPEESKDSIKEDV